VFVVFLKGLNVGGHRTVRPTTLVEQLPQFDIVNIGAAGTFVVRAPVARRVLREEIARRLPFAAEVVICSGREIMNLMATDFFAGHAARADLVRFVSVLAHAPQSPPELPLQLPAQGAWLVKVLARERRFLVGIYRRRMRTIGQLKSLDRLFGTPAATRNWKTMTAIAETLAGERPMPMGRRR
jgi:uncharacterized protein (DUF1697 family)